MSIPWLTAPLTFLPYPDFTQSARALDNRRLNKQLVEVQQILKALDDPNYGWRNHPAVEMWDGYTWALVEYGMQCYIEWMQRFIDKRRGGKLNHKSGDFITARRGRGRICVYPSWLGGPIHASHRAALKAKDPVHYADFGEEARVDLYWPVRK